MNIAVIGTGYVGLVSGTCFAEVGNSVVCVDVDAAKVKKMTNGKIPIYEPGLEELFHRNIKEGRLSFTTNLYEGIENADIIFLALPTPPGENGSADLSFILGVANDLGKILKKYTVIVNKSTVPVGTAEKVVNEIKKSYKNEFDVVSNPEFLKEGFAVEDFMNPDRVVIGSTSKKVRLIMKKLYEPFLTKNGQLIFMDERSAEMTKYAANAFLATKISFMNEIANLSEKVGANVDDIRLGIGSDERIGNKFLYSGIGYGGSCFPKDVQALQKTASENGYDFQILQAVTDVNTFQKTTLVTKIKNYYKGDIKDRTFALWGIAFKPNTDDIREAPSIQIIKELTKLGAKVKAFDPEATDNLIKQYGKISNLELHDNSYDVVKGADALIIATEWQEFKSPKFDTIKISLKKPVIFDGRNIYDPIELEKLGFYYESVGRKVINK